MKLEQSPLDALQRKIADALISSLDSKQSTWLADYLASGAGSANKVDEKILVLFGTESGNSETLADKAAKTLKKAGFKPALKNMSELSPKDLAKYTSVLTVVSTWGEGDPPETAEDFYKAFLSEDVDLSKVRFSVCGLGDTSYEQFCEIGKQMDARFEKLGAQRMSPRVDCDVDFDNDFDKWLADVSAGFTVAIVEVGSTASSGVEYGRKNPFPSEVIENQLINGEGSSKETVHLELDLDGSGLEYETGDALAVVPTNAADTVEVFLAATKLSADEKVTVKGLEETDFKTALTEQLDITGLSKAVLKKYNALANSPKLAALLEDDAKAELKDYLWGREIVDVLEDYPVADLKAQDLVNVMRKLPPRLYSIASSPKAHPGEVHLTVAAVRYDAHGKSRKGVASTYLADEAKSGEKVSVYVQPNKHFRLPEDEATPVIMVGPGTGIAPFRAFIEERGVTGNAGGSWLFFGDQKYTFDFLYQLELQDHLESGALTKLDVAFSRDQPEKVYVQHKMEERAAELYQWLEKGAHFYVCGDASRMAADVHDALIKVVHSEGNKSLEEATAYVDQLKKDKRYQRDVY